MDLPLDTLFDSLEDAILCVDDRSTLFWLNEAAAKLFGCERARAAGQPLARFPTLVDALGQLRLGELSDSGTASKAVRRLQVKRPSGELVPLEATVSCLLLSGQRAYSALLRDIRLQQRLEKAVCESRQTQALGTLAGDIAHEFNNILTAVLSQIDLALHAPEFPNALKAHLVYAQTSARRGAELVAKLQALGRQGKTEFAPVDLPEFSTLLPRSAEPAAPPKPVPLAEAKAAEGKERILVVDDEELVRLVTKAVLAYRGYKVVEAEDGQDAVTKYSAAPSSFDLILMDMHMPRLNGYDALVRIRQINPQAKAIILSGGVHDPEDGVGQMEKVAFLHKPFENHELVRLVRQLLDSA